MAAKITNDGLWRVTYGDSEDLSKEELVKRQPLRYEQILPGHPKPDEYKLVSMSPYKLQQRCAPSFRVGKILLVADAAHLCNPLYVQNSFDAHNLLTLLKWWHGLDRRFR
jgi:2-polyprenyl-6-methoxyphenol hydroxylase-like FAD-dependent oxidoreductase